MKSTPRKARGQVLAGGLAVLWLAGGSSGLAAQPLPAERVPGSPEGSASQFVSADAKGRVWLLDGERLAVHPVKLPGGVGDGRAFEALEDLGPDRFVIGAAVSPSGDTWLVQSFGGRAVRLFRHGEEQPVPNLAWRVSAVGWADDDPAVGVIPLPGGGDVSAQRDGEPPVLLALEERTWEPVLREPVEPREGERVVSRLLAEREVLLAQETDGAVWIATRHAYRLRRVSPAGRVLTEIVVGSPEVVYRERTDEEAGRLAELMAAAGRGDDRARSSASSRPIAVEVIQAIAVAGDGRVYVLHGEAGGDGTRLDRFDPVRGTVETVTLSVPGYGGRRTLAAGRDGLVLGNYKPGPESLWWVPWEALEAASWEEVEGAEIR